MSSSTSILDLYSRIPDYSEIKHLGNSDFINTLENLKEDYRRCRASLHDVHLDQEVEFISKKASKILNISLNNNQCREDPKQETKYNYHHLSFNHPQTYKSVNITSPSFSRAAAPELRIAPNSTNTNTHLYLPAKTNNCSSHFRVSSTDNSSENDVSGPRQYLSITSCELHKNPNDNLSATCNLRSERSSTFHGQDQSQGRDHHKPFFESLYAEDYELCSEEDSVGSAGSVDSGLSRWSSSPEIYTRDKEFNPPSNVEQRLLVRRSQNNSAPSIPNIETKPPQLFRANPVPSHVHKPLFDYIMLKNKRRSMRVRERSKQKLLAQVKPFSFSANPKPSKCTHFSSHGYEVSEQHEELLNNSRPVKGRKNNRQHVGVKTNNNKFGFNHNFKANPAPPRTKALLSAIKLKEQQEYRELKKKLRADALMKMASLPPSMAARDRRTKATLNRLDQILNRYNSLDNNLNGGMRRNWREASSDTFTDEDRLTDAEETYLFSSSGKTGGPNSNPNVKISRPCTSRTTRNNKRRSGNFTPYGELKFPSTTTATGSVFEATSNDNHASRLRVQVAREKELRRIKQEEEDLMRLMKSDKKRSVLRSSHAQAWRLAGSYSSAQDIAMRRQLRQAAAILEREAYKRDMSTMLTRVRSAPLLLEGLRERKFEPCKKHRDEMYGKSSKRDRDGQTPRKYGLTKEEAEKSETAAMAEGSLTNSDNESIKNPELDYDDDEDYAAEDNSKEKSSSPKEGTGSHNFNSKKREHEEEVDAGDDDVDEDTYDVNDDGDFEEDVDNDNDNDNDNDPFA